MNTDDTKPNLVDELERTVTVDEYLSGELPDGWTTKISNERGVTIIQSSEIDLFIEVKPDYGEEAVQLYTGPNRDDSELVLQERFGEFQARSMAYDQALAWAHIIAATLSEVANV